MVMCCGSVQVPGVLPLVQPAPPTLPAALSQPPEYQAQSTPLAESRSPIVAPVCGGSCLVARGPRANGWDVGWVVVTARAPQTVPAGGGGGAPGGPPPPPPGAGRG